MSVALPVNYYTKYYSIVLSLKNYKNYIFRYDVILPSINHREIGKQGSHDFPKPGSEYFLIVLAKESGCKTKNFRFI